MCKLIVGLKKNNRNEDFEKLIRIQERDLRTQQDGIGAVVIDKNKKIHVFRELTNYTKVFNEVYKLIDSARLVALHTRIKTSGKEDLDNVHMFEVDNYIFAHNGFVGDYSYSPKQTYANGSYNPYTHYEDYDDYDAYKKGERTMLESRSFDLTKKTTLDYWFGKDYLSELYKLCQGCKDGNKLLCRRHIRLAREDVNDLAMGEADESTTEKLGFGQDQWEEAKEVNDALLRDKKESLVKEFCDSYQFIHNIEKPLSSTIIEGEMEDRDFTGAGFILNKETLEAYLMVKKDVPILSNNKNFSMFFSYEPTVKYDHKIYSNKFGVRYVKNVEKISVDVEEYKSEHGVYRLDIKDLFTNRKSK